MADQLVAKLEKKNKTMIRFIHILIREKHWQLYDYTTA